MRLTELKLRFVACRVQIVGVPSVSDQRLMFCASAIMCTLIVPLHTYLYACTFMCICIRVHCSKIKPCSYIPHVHSLTAHLYNPHIHIYTLSIYVCMHTYNMYPRRNNCSHTVYPEMLVVIKFGDLPKIW